MMQVIKEGDSRPIKIWTNDIEDSALSQLKNIARLPFIHPHGVVAMPDVHYGIGATIGSVLATHGAIIPAAVGVDIGCVDAETEFLTNVGWKKISEYVDGDPVLCYNLFSMTSEFCLPNKFIKRKSNGFLHLKTKYGVDQMISPDHRVLVYHSGRKRDFERYSTISAQELYEHHQETILGAGYRFNTVPENIIIYTSVPFNESQLRVIVMTCADAYIDNTAAVLHFHKERKYLRALRLLKEADVEIISSKAINGRYDIRFRSIISNKALSQLWDASVDQLKIIADEVLYWDGNIKDQVFYTRKKEEADFVQWAFIASGFRGVIKVDFRDSGIDYRVFKNTNTKVGIKACPKSNIELVYHENAYEYCFQVQTGYFLIRRNGITCITGNCGMLAVLTNKTAADLPDNLLNIRHDIERSVLIEHTNDDRYENTCRSYKLQLTHLDHILTHHKIYKNGAIKGVQKAIQQTGTLGSGNHFVELCLDEQQRLWIMLHSGSRGIGNLIGNYFIELAKKEMQKYFVTLPDIDLAYLPDDTQYQEDYIEAVNWAQEYASTNRHAMLVDVLRALTKSIPDICCIDEIINCHHNYVAKENHFGKNVWLTRKGAIRARENDLGIIPGSMGQKSYIVRGKGNAESYCSCSHGAGRAMGRNQARKQFTVDDLIKQTEGVECRKDNAVLDEIPGAYKDIDTVMANQADLIEIVHTLKQIVCIKDGGR